MGNHRIQKNSMYCLDLQKIQNHIMIVKQNCSKNVNDCILEISAEKLQQKNLFDFFKKV